MKGIILSGGKGTRLWPLTRVSSKQLLPIYDRPMIFHPLEVLIQAGIKDILIIIAPEQAGQYLHLLGSGKNFGVDFSYEVQEEAKGLADAFLIGKKFIEKDNVTMILGDNIFENKKKIASSIKTFKGEGGRLVAKKVLDPKRFGIIEFDKKGKVVSIEEKPKKPKSNFAQTGIYIFNNNCVKIAEKLKPSPRGELEVTDISAEYLKRNQLEVEIYNGNWLDAGTFESLHEANILGKKMAKDSILNPVLKKYYWKK